MLLEKVPNVNAVDDDGMAALAHACRKGHEEVAVKLLRAGAYTNVQGCRDSTELSKWKIL